MARAEDSRDVITTPSALLERMGATMKSTVGPATSGPAKSQAYMAAVVLEKLAKQLELGPRHRAEESADQRRLIDDLRAIIASNTLPEATRGTLDDVARDCGPASLCSLVRALYGDRAALGDELFAQLLGRLRITLRADIDRRMEFAA